MTTLELTGLVEETFEVTRILDVDVFYTRRDTKVFDEATGERVAFRRVEIVLDQYTGQESEEVRIHHDDVGYFQ